MNPMLHDFIILALGAGLALTGTFAVPWLKAKLSGVSPSRLSMIFSFADLAFAAVDELVRKTETDIDDKAVEGLKKIEELLKGAGAPPLKPAEQVAAKLRFDALHAQQGEAVVGSPT